MCCKSVMALLYYTGVIKTRRSELYIRRRLQTVVTINNLWLQTSNKVIEYSLDNAEKTVLGVVEFSTPLVIKFEDPINKIDDLMCKSLDIVEQNVPIVTYTPEEVSVCFRVVRRRFRTSNFK